MFFASPWATRYIHVHTYRLQYIQGYIHTCANIQGYIHTEQVREGGNPLDQTSLWSSARSERERTTQSEFSRSKLLPRETRVVRVRYRAVLSYYSKPYPTTRLWQHKRIERGAHPDLYQSVPRYSILVEYGYARTESIAKCIK